MEQLLGFSQNNKIKKKIKNGQFIFFVDIFQLPQTVISNSEKLTNPTVHTVDKALMRKYFIPFDENFYVINAEDSIPVMFFLYTYINIAKDKFM